MQRSGLRFAIVVLVGALTLGACSMFQAPDDKAITSDILSKIYQDPVLKTREIHAVSEKGAVVLTGTVATDAERAQVERLASQASGVKQVINQLTIAGPPAASMPPPETAATPTELPARPVAQAPRHRASRRHEESASTYDAPMPRTETVASAMPVAAAPAVQPPAPPQPVRVTIPAGTVITVRLIDGIDTSRNHAGDEFAASVNSPVVVGDRVVIPQNAEARVRLVESRSAGHMTGQSEVELELSKLMVGSTTYNVETSVYKQAGASRGKRTAETVGGGAGLGALIGAIAGKGKGAAIGAAVGAGAGTAAEAATHGQQVRLPSETKLDFTLRTPFTVTL